MGSMEYAPWASLVLDLVLVLVVLGRAAGGWRSGLLSGGLGMIGMVGGAALGLWGWPRVAQWLPVDSLRGTAEIALLVLFVLVGASIGQGLLGGLGRRLSSHDIEAVHTVDRAFGAVAAAGLTVLVLGLLAAVVRPLVPPPWTEVMDRSRVVRGVDAVLPAPLQRAAVQVAGVLESTVFPRVFVGPSPEPVLPAPQPDTAVTESPAVVAAAASVMKVSAIGCGGAAVGSGWVASPERVVTNAHVVAGAEEVSVRPEGVGQARQATVIAFDPDVDLAVLYVPGLRADPLPTTGHLAEETAVAVAGFPGGGSYVAEPGRIRGTIEAVGADIYGDAGVVRQVYALRAALEQGNSGGPVLTTDGQVAGTVFARSIDDDQTGYALTDAQTKEFVDASADSVEEISSGACPG